MTINKEIYYESHMHKNIALTQEMYDKSIRDSIVSSIKNIDYKKIIAENPQKTFDNEYIAKTIIDEAVKIARG